MKKITSILALLLVFAPFLFLACSSDDAFPVSERFNRGVNGSRMDGRYYEDEIVFTVDGDTVTGLRALVLSEAIESHDTVITNTDGTPHYTQTVPSVYYWEIYIKGFPKKDKYTTLKFEGPEAPFSGEVTVDGIKYAFEGEVRGDVHARDAHADSSTYEAPSLKVHLNRIQS